MTLKGHKKYTLKIFKTLLEEIREGPSEWKGF